MKSRVSPQETAQFLRRKEEERQRQLDSAFAQATADAQAIIAMIKTNYLPRHVYQWGSLLRRERFTEASDIDIAVEGLASPEAIFRLSADAEELSDFPIDIVELEHIAPMHHEWILKNGLQVFPDE
jgi:predicted nucleotidyltransferase